MSFICYTHARAVHTTEFSGSHRLGHQHVHRVCGNETSQVQEVPYECSQIWIQPARDTVRDMLMQQYTELSR